MLYRGVAAMFSHVLIKNSRTGIVRQTVGSRELENVWVALAGSYTEKQLDNVMSVKARAYLKDFPHLFHPFPVFTVKPEISVLFTFE
jgi:hypothetical protein